MSSTAPRTGDAASAEVAGVAGVAVAEVVADGAVHTVFQPIVDLLTGDVVAHEALTRGPAGPLHSPMALFAAAAVVGLTAELDRVCLLSALRTAATELPLPSTLFINIEPQALDAAALDDAAQVVAGLPGLRVVLEITERALTSRPAELLLAVARVRDLGWGVALDDVGVEAASLALMPLLRPDVIKLDLTLVQRTADTSTAEVMVAVSAQAERTGAWVLAEGIETAAHEAASRALGATLGQGYRFGRPAAQPLPLAAGGLLLELDVPAAAVALGSPFALLPPGTRVLRAPKRILVELSKHLESEAARVGETCVVTASFQEARHFTPATAERYRALALRTGLVCALGNELDPEPQVGVRGADLAVDDPLRLEWDVTVLGPHVASALLAREVASADGEVPDAARLFDYALTHDRDTVVAATRSLLSRVRPA